MFLSGWVFVAIFLNTLLTFSFGISNSNSVSTLDTFLVSSNSFKYYTSWKKMIIELIAIKKIINISMNLLFINKIKIKGIYPAIINIPLSKLHNIPNIGIKPKKNKCIKLNFFNLIISYTIIRKINSGNSL